MSDAQKKPAPGELITAAANGNMAAIKSLLEQGADTEERNRQGDTALMYVVGFKKDITTVRLLLDKGADINAQNNDGLTPLHLAVNFGQVDVILLLLEKGADPNLKNKDGKTPVTTAREKSIDIAKIITEAAEKRALEKRKAEEKAAADERERQSHAAALLRQQRLKDLARKNKPKF
jgi:ankyrin repeat protein